MSVKGKPFKGQVTEETRKKMSLGRLGKKHSPEAIEKMKEFQRNRTRGSYFDIQETILRLCCLKNYEFSRTRNYWKVTDGIGVTHSFLNSTKCIEWLQGGQDYEKLIVEACKGTSYRVEMGWRSYTIFDGKVKYSSVRTAQAAYELILEFTKKDRINKNYY